jgi:hypothetical protein
VKTTRPRAPTLAPEGERTDTATMPRKNAVFLALIGTLLLTILLAVDFIKTVPVVLNDVVPGRPRVRYSDALH